MHKIPGEIWGSRTEDKGLRTRATATRPLNLSHSFWTSEATFRPVVFGGWGSGGRLANGSQRVKPMLMAFCQQYSAMLLLEVIYGESWGEYSQGQTTYITERLPSLFLLLLEQPIFNCYTRVIWPRSSRLWQLRRVADLSTFNQLTSLSKAESVHLQNSTYCLKLLDQGVQQTFIA